MELTIALIAAGASLVGAFAGATLQYVFTGRNDAARHRREMVSEAYVEYLRSVGEMESAQRMEAQQQAEATGRAIAAKARLCVHASALVVESLAASEALVGKGTGGIRSAMFGVVKAMRADLKSEGDVTEDQVSQILFGPPKNVGDS